MNCLKLHEIELSKEQTKKTRPPSKKVGTSQRTKNENTAMNEQAKVDGKLKLRLSGIKPANDRVEN